MLNETNHRKQLASTKFLLVFSAAGGLFNHAHAANGNAPDVRAQEIAKFWTPERRAQAVPRDLVIDPRGLGYLRKPDGTLTPYGHSVAAQKVSSSDITAFAKPSGSSDSAAPSVADMNPVSGAVIGSSYNFSAKVTDTGSGIKSVTFYIQRFGGLAKGYSTSKSGDIYSANLSGFTDGSWSWWVVAKDNARNTTTSPRVDFSSASGGSGSGAISNAEWSAGGAVQSAAGRIYFEMPTNSRWTRWAGYVCSGTVATDGISGRSIIITASHCVYDDANKAFARNVLFIPNQAGTSGTGTDLNCSNDPVGCWAPSFGVVDANWTTRTFPDNVEWDYAYYVVDDIGSHTGNGNYSALDQSVGSLNISFGNPVFDAADSLADFTHALGYSYSEDPNFMYCAEDMTTEGSVNWWLSNCGLSGGSSGGPWVQPMDSTLGSGPIISVNSWGYTDQPGMAGPKLAGTSAECVFDIAQNTAFSAVSTSGGDEGWIVDPLIHCSP